MRIALISDIHGNMVSLKNVLADIERQQVDDIVFLGDLATLGPQPREVVTTLRNLNCHCVMGNHDTFLFDPAAMQAYSQDTWIGEAVDWCKAQLAPEDLSFIYSFKPFLEITLDPHHEQASKLFCFHGSPRSNVDQIVATTSIRRLKQMLMGYEAAIFAGGHTHVQMIRQHKGTLIMNAGSVGQPFAQSTFKHAPSVLPWAEYAIIGWHEGALNVDLRRVPINLDAVKAAAMDSDLPAKHTWINNWQVNGKGK
ncbi:MAG: metallophosphoesterase family protein [Anaerolineales bacterium]|nr:metallophosphoesterase family protein [Anaerolineales bacterium]